MSEGDLVLLYIDERRSRLFRVKRGIIISTDKGAVRSDDVIGKEWGSIIKLSTGAKAYILRPTLMDTIMKGYRRVTQVIYPKDLSLILLLSGIGQGSKVIESGVGTGFLTTVLAHYVGDEGHVYGYEIRKEFAEAALKNLRLAGLSNRVTIKVKDIKEGIDESGLDAAFLDLPDPWDALEHVHKALKPSAPTLIFVPSVNQIIKTLHALLKMDFVDIHVYETLLREYQHDPDALRPQTLSVTHTGYVIFARTVKGKNSLKKKEILTSRTHPST